MTQSSYDFDMNFYKKSLDYHGSLIIYTPFNDFKETVNDISYDKGLRAQIISEGEAAEAEGFPVILATDYMNFKRQGNRVSFENKYLKKRHMVNALVLAEYVEQKGRFLDSIINGIISICEESTWCLPAHNSYIRDTEQFILPDCERPVLDLYACETGAQLSMILYLLQDKLSGVSELVTLRIKQELKKRIIEPYLNVHFWWMGKGDEPMCNWTPWCTQNILLCAFLDTGLFISDTDRRSIFEKAASSVDFFLKDYGVDGCCDEGAQYYKHAGLCLYGCMEILNGISNNHFKALYANEKIKNIAAYIALVHVSGPWYFNFSDCSPKAGRTGVREFLFGKETNQVFLCDFASRDYVQTVNDGSLLLDESVKLNLYYRVQAYAGYKELTEYVPSSNTETLPQSTWYESVGLLILRSENMALAIKAGDNDDSHNHNDTGSVTLYKNGQPILVDIGVETYTAKTFSPDRYSIWTMQSGYHNLPTLMGFDELPGKNYKAEHVTISADKNSISNWMSMNIESAYPEEISSKYYYKRKAELNQKLNEVTINDSTDIPDVTLNFISYFQPEILEQNDQISVIKIADATLSIKGASNLVTEVLPITDLRLKTAWDHDLYRVRFQIDRQFEMKIR